MSRSNKAELLRTLRESGITKAVLSFSGGNDEGYVNEIILHKADGSELPQDERGGLGEQLAEPIYDKWGGFAGDFSVGGTLTYDVEKGTASLDYEETEYVSHHEEL